jgi:tetratricopeptide (TPR) repeat protein
MLLTVAVYLPSLDASFVYDDYLYVVDNPMVTGSNVTLGQIVTEPFPWRGSSLQWYRPLTILSFRLNAPGGRLSGPAFHGVNLALHLLTTTLVLVWIRRHVRSDASALLAALLFAVMPGHAEAVLWVSGRSELLATTACVAALVALGSSSPALRLALPPLLLGLGLAAKESAVVLVGIVAAVLIGGDRERQTGQNMSSRLASTMAPMVVVLLLYLMVRVGVVGQLTPDADEVEGATYWKRLALSGRVWWQALCAMVYLARPSVEYYWIEPLRWTWQSLAGWGAVAAGVALWLRARSPAARHGIAVSLCGFALYSHLLASTELFAERFLYLPSVGFCLLVGAAHEDLCRRIRGRIRPQYVAALLLVCCLAVSVRTFTYARVWYDDLSLWRYTTGVAPASPLVWQNYGVALMDSGDPHLALAAFQRTLGTIYEDRRGRLNIVRAYGRLGDFRSGVAFGLSALQHYPDDPELLYLIGRHQILGGFRSGLAQTISKLRRLADDNHQAERFAERLELESNTMLEARPKTPVPPADGSYGRDLGARRKSMP